jgi:hypothetical protein
MDAAIATVFPRPSVGSWEEFGRLMQIVTNDLLNAAGSEAIVGSYTLELQ